MSGGQRRPWKVDYHYANGPKGRVACRDESEALGVIRSIRENRYLKAGRVVVIVSNVDDPDFAPKVEIIEELNR
jgi:hypothetical protein